LHYDGGPVALVTVAAISIPELLEGMDADEVWTRGLSTIAGSNGWGWGYQLQC